MWGVFGVALLAAFAYLLWTGRGNTFFFDEWGWLQGQSTLHWLLHPYNQHLQLVPVGMYYVLFHTVGLDHYWVWRVIQTSIHLAAVAVIFEFARRRLGWLALPLVLPIAVLGSGWDYVLWPVSMGFVASIGMGVGALLALDRGDRRGDVLALVLLLVGLVCCEFAAFFAIGIAVETFLRDRRLGRAWVWAIPLAAYALWWLVYQQGTAASHNLGAVPTFVLNLAASGVGGLFGLDISRGRSLLIAALLLFGWRIAPHHPISPRAVGLLVTVGVFWLAVALARAQLGTPDATRYVYTSAILLVLLLSEILRGVSIGRWQLIVAAVFVTFALSGNLKELASAEGALRAATQQVSAELAALQLTRATAPPELVVDSHYAPILLAGPYFAAIDQLHSSPADTPAQLRQAPETARVAADRLLMRAGNLRVRSTAPTPSATGHAPSVAVTGGSAASRGQCVHSVPLRPRAFLDAAVPARGIDLHAAAGPKLQIRLRRFATGFEGILLTAPPDGDTTIEPVHDGSSQPWYLRISFGQPIEVCALG